MNGTEKIIARILSDADRQTERMIEDARSACASRAAETASECASLLARAEEDAEKNASSILLRAESAAAMDTRRCILLSKASMLDRAYEEAKQAYPSVRFR